MNDKLHDGRTFHVFMPGQFDDLPLTLEAFRVYCHLARRADKTGKSFPSLAKIGEHCFRGSYPNSSDASLKAKAVAAIKELCAYGLIRKELFDEGEGYKHNNYFLTNSNEWKETGEVATESCNVRKGRPGRTRIKKTVNQDNPVAPDNSVNRDNSGRLTGITASVNRALPKGISNEGISNEGNPSSLGDGDASPSQEGKKKRSTKKSKSLPTLSKYFPDESLKLWDLWSPMYREFRGELDDRRLFMKGFDGLVESGVDLKEIEQGLRFYVEAKMGAIAAGRKDSVKIPPDGVRFFAGKNGGDSYCLRAYQEWQIRHGGSASTQGVNSGYSQIKHFDLAREKGVAIAMNSGIVYLSDDSVMPWEEFAKRYPIEKLEEGYART